MPRHCRVHTLCFLLARCFVPLNVQYSTGTSSATRILYRYPPGVYGECVMLNLPRPKRRLAKACGSNSRVVDSGMALALAAAIFALQASVE